MGADVAQLRALLQVRLMLDNRQPMNSMGRSSRKPTKYRIWGVFFLSVFTGLLYTFPLFVFNDLIAGWTIYYTAFGFLYAFTLITDLSHVLLDTKEKYIVQTRPVNDRTILLARLLHLFTYLFRTALPMSLGGWAAAVYYSGWKGALWFPITVLLLLLMVVFVVNLFYIALLRLVRPARFSTVLSYFQIAFAVILFASYQFLPRLFGASAPQTMTLAAYPVARFFPAYWIAGTWSWMGVPLSLSGSAVTGALAFAVPLLCMLLLVRVLAPQFSKRLALLDAQNESGAAVTVEKTPVVRTAKRSAGMDLAQVFTRSSAAEAGFRLSWALTGRSRSFRMRMITSLAYLPVYFVYLISSSKDSLMGTVRDLPNTNKYLMLLYMVSFVVMQSVGYLAMSDSYKAAWIYRAAPITFPGRVILGGVTAVWVKYILPFFAIISVAVVAVWGLRTLPDIILAGFNMLGFGLLSLRMGSFFLPFSLPEKPETKAGAKNILRVFFALSIPVALGGLHYLSLSLWWLKLLFMALSGVLCWLLWTSLEEKDWAFVERSYKALGQGL